MELAGLWFIIVFVLFAAYAVLDGYDLGVGSLHFLWRSDVDRRAAINLVAPVWDGNELWLLAGGAALLVAFPPVYVTVVGGLFILLLLVVVALIGRALAIEFRGKVESPIWQRTWDWVFNIGSILPALFLGIALGNVMRGLPLDADGAYQGSLLALLNPYAILIGVLTVVLFALYGALYLERNAEGVMRSTLQQWIIPLWCTFALLHLVAAAATVWFLGDLYTGIHFRPLFWVLSALWCLGIASVPLLALLKRYTAAFVGSVVTVATMVGLVAVALFPRLVPSTGNGFSLTIENSSASPQTLTAMLIVALVGIPFVVGYTAYVYRAFRGKVIVTGQR